MQSDAATNCYCAARALTLMTVLSRVMSGSQSLRVQLALRTVCLLTIYTCLFVTVGNAYTHTTVYCVY
jgi:hypothetical protein